VRFRRLLSIILFLFGTALATPVSGGPQAAGAGRTDMVAPPGAPEAAPAPIPPAVFSRNAAGKVTIRAVRLDQPLIADGRLDEYVYEATLPIETFEQQVPNEGAPATERTQAWVFFDDDNLYFSARCLAAIPRRLWRTSCATTARISSAGATA
jgi:hypothetical protein